MVVERWMEWREAWAVGYLQFQSHLRPRPPLPHPFQLLFDVHPFGGRGYAILAWLRNARPRTEIRVTSKITAGVLSAALLGGVARIRKLADHVAFHAMVGGTRLVGVFRAISRFEGKFERVEDGVSSDRSRNSFFFQEILFVGECWSFDFYVYVEGVVNLCWLICLVICTSFWLITSLYKKFDKGGFQGS